MGCVVDENNKVSCFKDSLASTPCGDIYQAEAGLVSLLRILERALEKLERR